MRCEQYFSSSFFLIISTAFCLYLFACAPFSWNALSFTHYFFLNFLFLFRVFIFCLFARLCDHHWTFEFQLYAQMFWYISIMLRAKHLINAYVFQYFSFACLLCNLNQWNGLNISYTCGLKRKIVVRAGCNWSCCI